MESAIVILACVSVGFIVGWHLGTRPHPDQIDRFFMKDHQDCERWEAYSELIARIGKQKQQ